MKKLISLLIALLWATAIWAQNSIIIVTTDGELRTAIQADGANITVTADIDLSNSTLSIAEGTTVTIDLGGHTLDRKLTKRGEGGGQVITVREGAKLNLSNGTLKGGWGGAGGALVNEGGTVTITDVIITHNVADDRGGGICNREGGTLTMTGGVITDNSSNDRSGAKGGGGIFNEEGATATLTNVTITGNDAKVCGGGGICNFGTLTIDGCTITGNTAGTYGGGIWQEGTLNMQGMVTISDNRDASGMVDNVYLKSGKVITVTDSLAGSNVGINMETAGVFTNGYNTLNSGVDPATIFTTDLTDVVAVNLDANNEAQLTSALLEGDVYYIERSWDNNNDKVVARTALVYDYQYTLLSNRNYDDDLELSRGTYVVQGNVYVDGFLKINGDTKLILCDGATMKVKKTIVVSAGNNFSVYGQAKDSGLLRNEGDNDGRHRHYAGIGTADGRGITFSFHGGTINVRSDEGDAAGIGLHCSHDGEKSSSTLPTIKIYGGNITAYGHSTIDSGRGGTEIWASPGIGSYICDPVGAIYIYGGYVYASGSYAAGLGTGIAGSHHDNEILIFINGGHVIATAGNNSAGIGGASGRSGKIVYINGGHVEAYGLDGAGIGCGSGCKFNAGKLTINGGYVYAQGGDNSAGIGGVENLNGQTVTITGGEVHAIGGNDGAGIGGGWCGSGGHLTVTGGTVIARGGGNGAGIGSGSETIMSNNIDGGTFIMTGGHVEAYGGVDAAGIGGGEDADGGTVNISGGYVYAEGNDYGAAIGGGQDGNGGNVTITGGIVIAKAGANAPGAIGGGEDRDNNGTLTFGDDRCVYITNNLYRCKKENRVNDCFGAAYLQISECLHGNPTYKVEGTTAEGTHTKECQWCTTTFEPEQHTFVDKVCTVCGAHETFGGETGIKTVYDVGSQMSDVWYTLDGRKLSDKPTQKGVYIYNGCKIVIK